MRVAILGVNYSPEPTGIAPYTTGLAQGLSRAGHHVRVFTSFPHYPQWRSLVGARPRRRTEHLQGVLVTRLRHYIPQQPRPVRRVAFESSFGARLLTADWTDADVVVCVSPALLASAMAIARARTVRRRPAIGLVVQDLYSRGVLETGRATSVARWFAELERRTALAADGVVAIHERLARQLVSGLDVPADRVQVIRNWTHIAPAPSQGRAHLRRYLGWDENETIVLHAGAMGDKQGLENVVDAARFADRVSASVRFVMVGDGGRRGALESAASDVGSIEFVDPVPDEDFRAMLHAADVLLVNERPGVADMAVPSKLTSYFRAGRPVLAAAAALSATAEEIHASGGGVVVDSGNPRALLDEALRLRDSKDECERLGAQGLAYCERILSEEVALDAYDAWVRSLAGRSGPSGRS